MSLFLSLPTATIGRGFRKQIKYSIMRRLCDSFGAISTLSFSFCCFLAVMEISRAYCNPAIWEEGVIPLGVLGPIRIV
jgi:hypothetical protein